MTEYRRLTADCKFVMKYFVDVLIATLVRACMDLTLIFVRAYNLKSLTTKKWSAWL